MNKVANIKNKSNNNKSNNNKSNNKSNKNNKSNNKSFGGDLIQKYSLASIDEGNELGRFKHSNTILGILGVGSLLYYVYYSKQHTM
jgi:hypothetical protein